MQCSFRSPKTVSIFTSLSFRIIFYYYGKRALVQIRARIKKLFFSPCFEPTRKMIQYSAAHSFFYGNKWCAIILDQERIYISLLFHLKQDEHTDKEENQIFLIYKEIQSGAVAKSYMRKGFLIQEEMRKYFPYMRTRRPLVIYDFATSPF